jgi:multidrug efflux pump subunit AcrB
MAPGTALNATREVVATLDRALAETPGIESVTWVLGRSAPAFYYNIVSGRDGAPGFAHALVRTASPEATETILPQLQRSLPTLAPEAQVLVRGLVQGPPVDAPVELRIVGPDIATLREEGARLRRLMAGQDEVTLARASITEGAPKVVFDVDEAEARRLGLSLADVAGQLEAALVGRTGGTLVEGTESLPIRVRLGDALRSDAAAVADIGILPAGAVAQVTAGNYPALPLSAIAEHAARTRGGHDHPPERRAREHAAGLPAARRAARGGAGERAGRDGRAGLRSSRGLPARYRRGQRCAVLNAQQPAGAAGADRDAVRRGRGHDLPLLPARRCRAGVSGLSAGLSMLSLAVFDFPFGINAIIGLIGSIGVSINAALIIMTALQEDPEASAGEAGAMTRVVMESSRHIVSTTITTVGGFLPLILAGGGFWPPFAMAVAGGVLLSSIVSFYFTPAAFRLVYARGPGAKTDSDAAPVCLMAAAE